MLRSAANRSSGFEAGVARWQSVHSLSPGVYQNASSNCWNWLKRDCSSGVGAGGGAVLDVAGVRDELHVRVVVDVGDERGHVGRVRGGVRQVADEREVERGPGRRADAAADHRHECSQHDEHRGAAQCERMAHRAALACWAISRSYSAM
jgi:hypothetical protein